MHRKIKFPQKARESSVIKEVADNPGAGQYTIDRSPSTSRSGFTLKKRFASVSKLDIVPGPGSYQVLDLNNIANKSAPKVK
jgi:hypothetical protein